MANGREVAPVRKLIAAVLGTVATFVILFGAGMTSWIIVALGVALLVLAVALVAVTAVRTGARAWVTGQAHVHHVSEPPAAYAFGRCELQIVIDAPGLPPRSVKVIDPRVPVAKWPDPGQTLPIKVAIDDQRHVRILWDEVPTHAERAAMADLPPEFDDYGPLGDDFLIEQDTPPWLRSGSDDDYPPPQPGEPVTADLTDDLGGLGDDPVVMHHGPGGTIVLEGTLVEPTSAAPLPRRPRPSPYPRRKRPATTDEPAREKPVTVAEPAQEKPARGKPAEWVAADPGFEFDAGPAEPGRRDDLGRPAGFDEPSRAAGFDDLGRAAARAEGGPSPSGMPTVPKPSPPLDDIDIDIDIDEPGTGRGAATRSAGTATTGTTPTGPGPTGSGPAGSGPAGDTEMLAGDEMLAGADAPLGTGGPAAGAGPISGVGITLLVTDLDTSVAFYREMLGFSEIDGGDGNAVLASGATRLVLRTIPDVPPVNRRLVHLNLEVADVKATYAGLKDKGVQFTYAPRVVNRGERLELWAAAFRDPDGHGIALTEWRDRPID